MKKIYNLLVGIGSIFLIIAIFKYDNWIFYIGRVLLAIGVSILLTLLVITFFHDRDMKEENVYTLEFWALTTLAAISSIAGAILELLKH